MAGTLRVTVIDGQVAIVLPVAASAEPREQADQIERVVATFRARGVTYSARVVAGGAVDHG